jgi:hypothetical protein
MTSESTEHPDWRPAAELAWLALWIALLSWGLVAIRKAPSHAQHDITGAVVFGAIALGLPISAIVALALFVLAFLATQLGMPTPAVPPSWAVLGYWLVFAVPGIWQRATRLSYLRSLWCLVRGSATANGASAPPKGPRGRRTRG